MCLSIPAVDDRLQVVLVVSVDANHGEHVGFVGQTSLDRNLSEHLLNLEHVLFICEILRVDADNAQVWSLTQFNSLGFFIQSCKKFCFILNTQSEVEGAMSAQKALQDKEIVGRNKGEISLP